MRKFFVVDVETTIFSKIFKSITGNWECQDCGYNSAYKKNVFEHVESKHVKHSGYYCDICSRLCPTSSSLRMHYNRNHKGN